MQRIGDRVILVLCCLALVVNSNDISMIIIIASLLAFTISCLGIYIDNKLIRLLQIVIYILLSFYDVVFIFFIPVIMYEWLNVCWSVYINKREHVSNIVQKDIIMFATPAIIMGIAVVYNLDKIHYIPVLCISGLTCIAVWLNVYCNNYSELKQQFIINRDNSVELTLALENKNNYLIEKQDYEIYLATLRERNRIAREIHDNVGHLLSRSILQTGAVITINKDVELQPHLKGIKDTLDLAMTSIRTSVHDLHDESIDLKEAIIDITKDMKDYNVNIDFDMSNNVPTNIKYCFISVIKEAISNIIKHSNADKVHISLREHPAFFRLLVEDNGTICKKANKTNYIKVENDGIGLSNIKERVESFHGTLNIDTSKGFRIIISILK